MAFIVKPKTQVDFQVTHEAELIDVSLTKDDQYVRFSFKATDIPSRPYISGICPNVPLEPGTQLHRWLSAFNGEDLEVDESVDEEDFVGYIMEVKLKESEDGKYINVVDIVSLIRKPD